MDRPDYWNKETGFDPIAYAEFRANINPDRRACCYPETIGAIVKIYLHNQTVTAKITAYDRDGFHWRDVYNDDHTGRAHWIAERGLTTDNGSNYWAFAD